MNPLQDAINVLNAASDLFEEAVALQLNRPDDVVDDIYEEIRTLGSGTLTISLTTRPRHGSLQHFALLVTTDDPEYSAALGRVLANVLYIREQHEVAIAVANASGEARIFQRHKVSVRSVARWLEFGTVKMPAHPFMTTAFESKKEELLETMLKPIREVLNSLKA